MEAERTDATVATTTPKRQVTLSHSSEKYERYYDRIEKIDALLEKGNCDDEQLEKLQSALDKLAAAYGTDRTLGPDRYALLQAQALLHRERHEYEQAREFMEAAVRIRGENYPLATEFLATLPGGTAQPARRSLRRVGRINRSSYFLSYVVSIAIMYAAAFGVGLLDGLLNPGNSDLSVLANMLLAADITAWLVYGYLIACGRLHDLGQSAWWALSLLIPLFNLYMAVKMLASAGIKETNRFGPAPARHWRVWPAV